MDTDHQDRVVAGMRWMFFKQDPFGDSPPDIPTFWLGKGPMRGFANAILDNLFGKLLFTKKLHVRKFTVTKLACLSYN